jgi:CubicO group peptidase (beta-lactamase class C family)
MNILIRSLAILACGLPAAASAVAAPGTAPTAAEIDRLANRALKEFSVPGLAVAIVKDGRVVMARGYGVRELGKPAAVDADTLFAIGSNTKEFTAASVAILVDEGKLHWDDRVIDYLPDFRMWDPYVTREFTIRDLLTHRSGLGIGAGDLMFVTATDFTRADLLRGLRFLKPASSFRSQFAYDNLLYVIAGQVVAAVSGQSWEDFVTARILKPLHMDACAADDTRLTDRSNLAAPHLAVNGTLTRIPPLSIPLVAPAGAIQCNLVGMAKWVSTQLAHGTSPDGVRLFSEAQGTEMWSPQTLLPVAGDRQQATHTHFMSYGLGWMLEDTNGYERVWHNGGLPGMVTHVSLVPELNLGVIVLTNQQEGAALEAISLQILDAYTGVSKRDWIEISRTNKARRDQRMKEADAKGAAAVAAAGVWTPPVLHPFVGTFNDPWRGNATISQRDNELELTFSHTDALSGSLTPVAVNLFIVRWKDRSLNADAYVRFAEDYSGNVSGFTMQAVSATTDFSYDFQDLSFVRVSGSH